ncbi:H-NS family nucleoid-associated regulatory protein [Salipiger mucosus]|uniref:Histone-like nucleoid-structuring protein H-NS n=1 Tax=Salipiger mucosus DSM 16094 TaxID=1123237 RepID=S9S1I4_9RHOB|nr:H-NS histone family protein [Salipiger mucosus]EPX84060.1 histone-like nucleoid-structuring protein H-NS [Salipiger mucosus DSM 16094]
MNSDKLLEMNREQLLQLRADIDAQLEKREVERKNEARAALKKIEEQYGFSLDQLTTNGNTAKKTKGIPKYANPDDPSKTWTGRGRKPQWVIDALDQGKSLDDLLIQ